MITRERISVSRAQDQNGGMVPYTNVAAYEWRTDLPLWPDSLAEKRWPILAEYPGKPPVIVWYFDNAFRASNGNQWARPSRWAYLRMEEEVWNPEKGQWEINGLTYTQPEPSDDADDKPGVYMNDIQGQWMIDDLKRSFTVNRLNKFMEASPYDEPDRGAPLE